MGAGKDMTGFRIIRTDSDVAEGLEWLAERDGRFDAVFRATGPLPLRRRAGGFASLLNAVVAQQVSTAAAAAIWQRLEAGGLATESGIMAAPDEALRQCGLSRPKVIYARALAESGIDYGALEILPDAEVIKTLVAVKGIGRWTAEIYAMFSLGRADVFAAGDLALQESARHLFGLNARPDEKTLRKMAEDWSPWRGVAARALWAYYRVIKNREGSI